MARGIREFGSPGRALRRRSLTQSVNVSPRATVVSAPTIARIVVRALHTGRARLPMCSRYPPYGTKFRMNRCTDPIWASDPILSLNFAPLAVPFSEIQELSRRTSAMNGSAEPPARLTPEFPNPAARTTPAIHIARAELTVAEDDTPAWSAPGAWPRRVVLRNGSARRATATSPSALSEIQELRPQVPRDAARSAASALDS